MWVIAGLGNPGRQYLDTRHNLGFKVIDRLSKDYNIDVDKLKHKAFIGDGIIKGKRSMLVKPQTFMNLSGESLKDITSFYKIPSENIIIVYDDTSLPLGACRIRKQGSAGGHNGIKSIIQHLNTEQFIRIKIGIGEKPSGWDLADYVLSKFADDDMPLIQNSIERAAEAVSIILEKDVDSAMNAINQKKR